MKGLSRLLTLVLSSCLAAPPGVLAAARGKGVPARLRVSIPPAGKAVPAALGPLAPLPVAPVGSAVFLVLPDAVSVAAPPSAPAEAAAVPAPSAVPVDGGGKGSGLGPSGPMGPSGRVLEAAAGAVALEAAGEKVPEAAGGALRRAFEKTPSGGILVPVASGLSVEDLRARGHAVPGLKPSAGSGALVRELLESFSRDEALPDFMAVQGAVPDWGSRAESAAKGLIALFSSRRSAPLSEEERLSLIQALLDTSPGASRRYLEAGEEPLPRSLFAALSDRALRLHQTRYLEELRERGRRLYLEFLPGFYRELDVELAVGRHPKFSRNGEHRKDPDSRHRITLLNFPGLSHPREGEVREGPAFPSADPHSQKPIRVRIETLMYYVHEYAHALFHEAVGPSASSAHDALNEGFAVTVELLIARGMLESADRLGLAEDDAADLRAWIRGRLSSLKRERNHYTVGTFYFWHALYKRSGKEGMLSLLRSLDSKRLSWLGLQDPEFMLIQGHPELFAFYLSRDGDPDLQAAMHELVYPGSRPLSPDARAAARVLSDHFRRGAVLRFLRSRILPRSFLPPSAAEAIELAGRHPRLRAELEGFLERLAADPRPLASVLAKAEPEAAGRLLRDIEDALPQEKREAWRRALERASGEWEDKARKAARDYLKSFFDPPAEPLSAEELARRGYDVATPSKFEEARYFEALKERNRRLYLRFFPDFFEDVAVQVERVEDAGESGRLAEHSLQEEAGGARRHRVRFKNYPSFSRRSGESSLSPNFVAAHLPPIRLRMEALLVYFHEYAHALFIRRAGVPEGRFSFSAYNTLAEGFAVTLELLLVDKMLKARAELGLSSGDMEELRLWKRARLSYLKSARNHYTDGTLRVWHKIHKESCEAGMLEYLRRLDSAHLSRIDEDDPNLLLALGQGDLLRRAPLIRGGEPVGRESLSPGALRRMARRHLSKHPSPRVRAAELLSAARGWPALARAALDYLFDPVQPLARFGAVLRKASRDGLAEFFSGVEALLSPEQKKEWAARLEAWLRGPASASAPKAARSRELFDHLGRLEGIPPAAAGAASAAAARRAGRAYP